MYMYFPSFSLENKLFGIYQNSVLPVEELEFAELKTPLVKTFFPPINVWDVGGRCSSEWKDTIRPKIISLVIIFVVLQVRQVDLTLYGEMITKIIR